ncbi:MAG: putative glycosyl transferase [Candidatus Syntrophoarchaeum sp. GoM_oil]|nr:MAG: putative glycosyl transferase [Candidatus Syntrophoarchaeum sp. GoM_oil]
MKILLVSTQDYIHHPVPSRHHYIFEELATRHEVHVPHFHVSEGRERETRLIVHEATRYPVKNPALHYLVNAPHHYSVFKKIIRDEEIDVVVAAHVLAGTAVIRAAKKYGVPVVFDLKDWFPDSAAAYYKNRLLKWLLKEGVWQITRYNLKRSDKITTVSPSLVDRLNSLGFDAKLITNGVDTDYFKPMDSKEGKRKLGLDDNPFVIGFVGSIERWYALDEVIKRFPEILHHREDASLLIVGGSLFTDYEDELKELVKALGITDKVVFTGLIEYRELPKYISAMDLCLIPLSPSDWVNIALPNKFFEYSACGKPILSTPIPDMMKIGGENLFIYKNMDEFVERVKEIMENPRTFTVDTEGYSWKKKAEEMEGVLEEIGR